MRRLIAVFIAANCLSNAGAWAAEAPAAPREPIVGLPCEGCDAVFDGRPAVLTSSARIAPPDEPGEPMRITGTVFAPDGNPAPGVIVYAYHTDAHGIYPREERHAGRPGSRHGLLRGWVKTGDKGQYRFDTIRPAGYPGTKIPAHVHMHVIEAGRCTYAIDELLFEDDPRLTPEDRRKAERGRGGRGLSAPHKDADGIWTVARDIVLGEGIPGYPTDGGTPHD